MDSLPTHTDQRSDAATRPSSSRRPISIRDLLGTGIRLWIGSISVVLSGFVLLLLPAAYFADRVPRDFAHLFAFRFGDLEYRPIAVALRYAILTFAGQLFLGAITNIQIERGRGREFSASENLGRLGQRAIPLIVWSFVVAVVVGVAFGLFVIPGLFALAILAPMGAMIASERVSGMAALRRCLALTSGNRILLFIVSFALQFILVFVISGGAAIIANLMFGTSPQFAVRFNLAINAFVASIVSSIIVAFYSTARGRLDGPDVDKLAAIFE